jgi:predicted esterase
MAGYSWYFYNPETDEYLLDMQSSLEFLAGLLKHLGFATTPTTVIGFSQGGYLAPFLAQRSSAIDHVIGMGCEFLDEELAIQGIPKHVRMDALHGARDDRCSPEKARSAQARLRAVGVPGEFVLLPETGHQFDAPARHELRRLVQLDAP